MKNAVLIVIAGFAISISVFAVGSLTTPASGYDAGKAEATFAQYCNGCHNAERSLRTLKGETNWKYTIERMAFQYKLLFGEPIPQQAQRVILEYLIQNAGKE